MSFQEYMFSFSKPQMLWIYQACAAMIYLHKKNPRIDIEDALIDRFTLDGLREIMRKVGSKIPKEALVPLEKAAQYQMQGLSVDEWAGDFKEHFEKMSIWLLEDDTEVNL